MDFGLQVKLTVVAIAALVGTVNIVVAITAYGQEEIASATEVTKKDLRRRFWLSSSFPCFQDVAAVLALVFS